MGCQKLTYREELPTLKVVKGIFSNEEKSSAGIYRYGFNGKEKDDEVSGNGNSYDYGFRIYNPRLGRFLSVDPLTQSFPWYTPYQYAGNKPIWKIDLDGLEETDPIGDGSSYNVVEKIFDFFYVAIRDLFNSKPVLGKVNTSEIETKAQAANTPAAKANVDLSGKVPFVSQFSLARPNVACCRASQKILSDFGLNATKSDRIITAKNNADNSGLDILSTAKSGVNYIDAQLDKGNPVMVGVDYDPSKGQSDGEAADHFVVITGRNTDDDGNVTYNFYEVGTKYETKGKSDKNTLKLNSNGSLTGTNYAGKKKFTVTDVRKNKAKGKT